MAICAVVTILLAVSGVAQATWTSVSDPLALTAINHWSLDEALDTSADWATDFTDSVSGNTAYLNKAGGTPPRAAKVTGVLNEGLQLTSTSGGTGVKTSDAVALPGVFAVDLYVKNLGWETDEAQKIFGIEDVQYATDNDAHDVPFFVYKTIDNKIAVGINTASSYGSAATRQAIVSDSAITDANWHRVVAGYDGEMVHLYIDGTEVGTGLAATPYKAGDPVWTGYWRMSGYSHLRSSEWTGVHSASTNYLYVGGIDEVRVLPEPATICLLGLGALSLIRKKRA
jgi:hypothetical protein